MASGENGIVSWWLVIGGAVLVLFGIVIFVAPGLFLEFLTLWAGVGFLISGAAGITSYLQLRSVRESAGWGLFMAILDVVIAVLLIVHPFAFASAIPWLLGAAFVVFGAFEVVGMMPFAHLVPETRIIAIISGILTIIVGVMFIIWPTSLSIWIAVFALVRGVTLISMGFTSRL